MNSKEFCIMNSTEFCSWYNLIFLIKAVDSKKFLYKLLRTQTSFKSFKPNIVKSPERPKTEKEVSI